MSGDLVNSGRDLEKKVENLSRELFRLWGHIQTFYAKSNDQTKKHQNQTSRHCGFTARSKLSAGQVSKAAETESAEWKEVVHTG